MESEFYLNSNNFERRCAITEIRISLNCLLIEKKKKKRYLKIPTENRLCSSCNIIEDEKHFL